MNSGCAINNSEACAGRTSYTGTWTARTADPSCSTDECRPYPETAGATYHRSESNLVGTDLPRFTWSLPTPGPGRYRVYAHWPVVAGAGLANFSISHQGGVAVVSVNQSSPSGAWQSMGSYDFDTNTSISLSPAPGSVAIADAVKLVPVEDIANDTANWAAIGEGGEYKLYARWPAVSGASSSAPFTITDSSGSSNLTTDQSANTATWNLFGTFTFDDPTTQGIKLNAVWDKKVLADAFHFVPVAASSSRHHLAYFHVDQLNTPQKMTDPDQQLVWDAVYQPFGEASITSAPHYDNPLRFPGQYFDAETGLHYNWWRYMDPATGRYMSSDPIGLAGGLSTYGYAFQNPLKFTDPTGLAVWICSRKARGIPGNHSYFWDDRGSGRACGREDSSGYPPSQGSGPSGTNEVGPPKDTCVRIPDSEGWEDAVMKCCEKSANNYTWIPWANDCQTSLGRCTEGILPNSPKAPGGRVGPLCEDDSCKNQ